MQRLQEDMTFKVPGTGMGQSASVVRRMPGLCRTAANVPAQGSHASGVDDDHPR
ncbi:hypothetical protein R69749_07165 [Paraburkholderia domus]|jgi:hypothetical protein|nr:hypothetical protein R70006_04832 [Paraburkholderia domus]CAE6794641.1 hypothetical protein R75483_05054 [Paraburkholderia domus]CAE6883202.1 hypothetical protein R69749_07165 [Paraburkholderia domus]